MGPLARRSLGRLARGGVWGLLVGGAFLLLATAAASVPIFAETAANAALDARIAAVPPEAPAAASPVVRLVGGEDAAGRARVLRGLRSIPGTTTGTATATSVGAELRAFQVAFTPFVAAGGRTGRARLYGDDALAQSLVPAPGSPPADTARPGVWLPAPLATELGLRVGDRADVGVQYRTRSRRADTLVAGIYQVGPDGRTPADPPGQRRWSYRRADAPRDTDYRARPAYLVISDVATTERIAEDIGDQVLYAVEAALDPPRPTLRQARVTAAAILQLRVEVRDPAVTGIAGELDTQVVSGVPTMVDDALRVTDRTVAWTSTAGSAGLGLGLVAVLAVAVFGLVRRSAGTAARDRHRHPTGRTRGAGRGGGAAGGAGRRARRDRCRLATGGSGGAGRGDHRRRARGGGATHRTGPARRRAAGRRRDRAGRDPSRAAARPRRPAPAGSVEAGLVAVAATATAGLSLRPVTGGPPSTLDLLVPVLLLAAVGAGTGRLALRLARPRRAGTGESPARAWSRRPALTLARRRVAAGGPAAVLLVTVLTVGFGFLAYALTAAASVRQVSDDRVAVLAGARTTVEIPASWQLDPAAPRIPERTPGAPEPDPADELEAPAGRNPPLPAEMTTVWRSRITVPPEYGNLDLMVVDPKAFARVASWGTGPELARARALLVGLADDDERATTQARFGRHVPIPALAVGPVQQRAGDEASARSLSQDVPISVRAVVPAFPGYSGNLPMIVVPANSFLSAYGPLDPRVAPRTRAEGNPFDRQFQAAVWSTTGPDAVGALLTRRDVPAGATTTYAQADQDPDIVAARRSTGYLAALGVCVAALAGLGLAMFAERAADRSRAADLMLTRMGLGGTGRAAALELGLLGGLSLLAAGVAGAALMPLGAKLLDPGGTVAPAFVLRPAAPAGAAAVGAVLVAVLLALLAARPRRHADPAEVLRDGQ